MNDANDSPTLSSHTHTHTNERTNAPERYEQTNASRIRIRVVISGIINQSINQTRAPSIHPSTKAKERSFVVRRFRHTHKKRHRKHTYVSCARRRRVFIRLFVSLVGWLVGWGSTFHISGPGPWFCNKFGHVVIKPTNNEIHNLQNSKLS
jgi:hypothetical protein